MKIFLVFVATLCATLFVQAADVTISPSSPKQNDVIRLQAPRGVIGRLSTGMLMDYAETLTRISMASNKISVDVVLVPNNTGAADLGIDYPIGVLPPGTYELQVFRRLQDGTSVEPLSPIQFSVTSRAQDAALWNHSDLWWDPEESGIGMNVIHHSSGRIFAEWFVYEADKSPIWYVVPDGRSTSPTDYVGTVYRTTANPVFKCNDPVRQTCFDPTSVSTTAVGSLEIRFQPYSANRADFSITIDGVTHRRTYVRQSF